MVQNPAEEPEIPPVKIPPVEISPVEDRSIDLNPGTEADRAWMQRCLTLAQHAAGHTAPNPLVGSVIVQGSTLIGEGFHPQAGQPHAEIFALRAAGDRAQGATLYVNLEPCSHQGRTPPCADALIAAGLRKVVVGMMDPNPLVAGRGIARLQAAGIEVVVGVEAAACERLNEAFCYRMVHQRVFGILKYAMTLDGKIAATGGHSTWVTGPPARQAVHALRAGCDAVIVGGNTVRRDNPLLTSRQPGRSPLRVVMSRTLDLPRSAQLWDVSETPTLVATQTGVNLAMQNELRDRGVEVVEFDALTPAAVMANLYDRGFLSVLWECGGTLAAEAIADGSVQKVVAMIAPKIIGGPAAPSPVGELGFTQMTDALVLQNVSGRAIGTDWVIEGYIGRC
jgi:diaminohydroxyphosphoribosylaminopyrimidine deaminase / 5-amino-6-(5-phosphoribosylamino)uracil reductase